MKRKKIEIFETKFFFETIFPNFQIFQFKLIWVYLGCFTGAFWKNQVRKIEM